MGQLKKKMKAKAVAARANLDSAILAIKNARIEQLMAKLDEAKSRLELERDTAWQLASGILAKVKEVRESLMTSTQSTRTAAKKPKRVGKRPTRSKVAPIVAKAKLKSRTKKKSRARRLQP